MKIVASVATVLTLAWMYAYGAVNQATYLLDPLHRAMPELYHRDWFVNLPSYSPTFGTLTWWLYPIDAKGTAFLVAHVVVNIAMYAGMYWIVRQVSNVRTWVIVAAWATMTMCLSMGGSYLLANYLQPSSPATVGWLFAISFLIQRRWLACGIAAAIAGLLHPNFLVLGVGLFPVAAVAIARVTLKQLAMVLVPQLVALAVFLPTLLHATGPSPEAIELLVKFHAPVHFDPHRHVWAIPELLAWELAAFAALGSIDDRAREARALWRFSLVAFAIVSTAALLANTLPWHALVQINVSRIAPFGLLAAQVLVATAMLGRKRRIVFDVLAIGAVLMTCRQWHFGGATIALLVAMILAARYATTFAAVIALVVALWWSPRFAGVTTEPFGAPTEIALETWAREHTDTDALFAIPPGLGRFRLLARRAVVVDTKSPPLQPVLLVEWYHRLCTLVSVENSPTFQAVEVAYDRLTPEQFAAAAAHFDVDYVITAPATRLPWPIAFENADFVAYRVTGTATVR